MSYLGIDLGTTGTRVSVCDEGGNELAARSRRTTVVRPAPGRAHIDAQAVLGGVEALVRDVLAAPAVAADPVEALSFSTLGEAVVPVDRAGRALGPAPLSMDGRGAGSAARLGDLLGGEVVQAITGQPLHPMFSVHKVRQLLPDGTLPAAVRTMDDFVATHLGAAPAVDRTMAARTGAYDVGTGMWSATVLDALDLPGNLFSPVTDAGEVVGAVSAEAAVRTGLAVGTPIVAGVHDQAAAFLGGGGRPGERAVFSFGSSDCLTVGTGTRPAGIGGTGLATYQVRDGLWVTLAGTAAGGFALDWFSTIVHHDRIDPWASLYDVGAVEPPRLLVAPYLAGSGTLDNDPGARGALLGLTLETTTAQIARAFVESSGFELAKIQGALATRGIAPVDVFAVGGGSANPAALQARADAAGVALRAVVREAAGRGAALLAALGAGAVPSVLDLPAPSVLHAATPDPRHVAWYASQRATFDSLHRLLAPVSTSLAAEPVGGTTLKEIA